MSSDTQIELELDYALGLGFGFSGNDGFYVDVSGVTPEGEDLSLELSVTIPDNPDPNLPGFMAQLFFLEAEVWSMDDADGDSGLYGQFTIDMIDQGGDGLWTLFNPKTGEEELTAIPRQ